MRRTLLHSKIHRATVTEADLDYEGSITVDPVLLEAADIREFERVDVLDITNGARLTTYTILGEPGSGEICINGAAAHLVKPGDLVILVSYVDLEEDEIENHRPIVIQVNQNNEITAVSNCQNA
ncbi:MAG: aspartate 1-decarboxylase [Planctomycetota bacterium]|nr:aspartate 1-decarboxylase [Planctomycetota bacterium]